MRFELKTYSRIFTGGVLIIAVLGLLGYIPGWRLLASFNPEFIPMAPSTSVMFMLSGAVLLFISNDNNSAFFKNLLTGVSAFVLLFGLLEVVGYFTEVELNFEAAIVPDAGNLNGIPIARMSPSTGALFLLAGIILILSVQFQRPEVETRKVSLIIGVLNVLLFITSFLFCLAYLYEMPLLYADARTIPMAFTTALGFLLLAFAIINHQKKAFPVNLISENTTRGFLLRYILPLTITSFIFGGLVVIFSLKIKGVNPAVVASALTILIAGVAVSLATFISRHVGGEIDRQKKTIELSEQALRKSEKQFRLLLDSTAEGIYGIDVNGNCTFINQSALSILGINKISKVVGKSIHELIHYSNKNGERLEKENCEICKAFLEDRRVHSDDEIFWRANNTPFTVEYFSHPIRNKGKVTGAVVTFWDISERKKSEKELLKLKKELEIKVNQRTVELEDKVKRLDKSQTAMLYMVEDLNRITAELKEERRNLEITNEELEAFTYSVSHDLRAPLRAINGFSNFLLEDYYEELDDEGKRFIDTICSNATKMDRLISDLLNLSRVSRTAIKNANVDMKATAKSMFLEIATNKEKNDFEVIFNDMPPVKCDLGLVKQVWQNLIANALKYSAKSSVKKIEIGAFAQNNETVYFVRDYGAGFNSKYSHKLFGAFQRLHKDDEFEGNGIGLALVQRIILRHAGKVWAEGETDKGATFYFSIPSGKNLI